MQSGLITGSQVIPQLGMQQGQFGSMLPQGATGNLQGRGMLPQGMPSIPQAGRGVLPQGATGNLQVRGMLPQGMPRRDLGLDIIIKGFCFFDSYIQNVL